MRRLALLVLGSCLALGSGLLTPGAPAHAAIGLLPAAAQPPIVKIGYWCSPGFEASYGRCVATAASDEVDLYLNQPGGYDQGADEAAPPRVYHRHRRHGLHERY